MDLAVGKSPNLRGMVRIPPNKSHSFRALIMASLAEGTSRIACPMVSNDWMRGLEALDGLIGCCGETLRRHLGRYVPTADAEDLLQELWLRVWQRSEQWEGRGRPLTWLLAVATNLALNHLRSKRAAVSLEALGPEDTSGNLASASEALMPGPEEQALWREQLDRVSTAVALLPPGKRAAIRLVRVQGYTVREAAALLGVPVGTLKSRLHHAHRLLMEQLEDEL